RLRRRARDAGRARGARCAAGARRLRHRLLLARLPAPLPAGDPQDRPVVHRRRADRRRDRRHGPRARAAHGGRGRRAGHAARAPDRARLRLRAGVSPRPPGGGAGAGSAASIPSVRISVRLFAGLRERAGADRVEVELPDGASVADLLAAMELAPRSCIVALHREDAAGDPPTAETDEVALVPPVSGGESPVRLAGVVDAPLDIATVAAAVRDPRAGAVVTFEGVTREVEALDYEAYAEMATEKLRAIGE